MTDAELLDWLADECIIEGFGGVNEDLYEIAIMRAVDAGREEPNQSDLRAALRELIRRAAQQPASDGGEAWEHYDTDSEENEGNY